MGRSTHVQRSAIRLLPLVVALGFVAGALSIATPAGASGPGDAHRHQVTRPFKGWASGTGAVCVTGNAACVPVLNSSVGRDSELGWIANNDQTDGTDVVTAADGSGTLVTDGTHFLDTTDMKCPTGYSDHTERPVMHILSGTGRFAGATGTFIMDVCAKYTGFVDQTLGLFGYSFVRTFEGWITY